MKNYLITGGSGGIGTALALLLIFVVLLPAGEAFAQSGSPAFHAQSLRNNNTGMVVLGSWAILNISTGAIGWRHGEGARQYFHQMNLFWNGVNLAIAAGALLGNHLTDFSQMDDAQLMARHMRMERLFLINAGLDVLYMAAGLGMTHWAGRSVKHADRLLGYGRSVILQGGFLLIFDAAMYLWQRSLRLEFMDSISLGIHPAQGLLSVTIGL